MPSSKEVVLQHRRANKFSSAIYSTDEEFSDNEGVHGVTHSIPAASVCVCVHGCVQILVISTDHMPTTQSCIGGMVPSVAQERGYLA